MQQTFDRHLYRILLGVVTGTLATGTVVYHYVQQLGWVDAYYLSVVTLATVGYGDITPSTTLGKLFTTLYIFIGVEILTIFISYNMRCRVSLFEHRHPQHDSDE